MAAKFGQWMLSPTGRKVAGAFVMTGAAGSFLAYCLPNTLYLDNFKEVTSLYRDGYTVPVAGKVSSLVEEVMNDLGLSQREKELISTYTVFGFDIFHAGMTRVNTGGILGIPISFKYSSEEEFVPTNVTVNNEPVHWSTEEGQSLKQSLILSDEAKKFAVAREVTALATAEPLVFGTLCAGSVAMVYVLASGINAKHNFYVRPRTLRVLLYGMTSLFGYAFCVLLKDITTVNNEEDADSVVANMGEKYARGGLEFYEKILQRNVAMHKLMGSRGAALYTAYGNDQVFFRTKHLPFTQRRDYMKSRVEEYVKGRTSADEETHTWDSSTVSESTADTKSQTEDSQDVHTLNSQDVDTQKSEMESTSVVLDAQTQSIPDN